MAQMLTIDPTSRTDVASILEHPFLQLFRWPEWEQMPEQASLDAARFNLRLYDTTTMGVREWKGKDFFPAIVLPEIRLTLRQCHAY